MTVRRALAELRAEGLIVTEMGRRTIVRPRSHVRMLHTGANYRARRSTGRANFTAEMAAQGQRAEQRLLEVATVPAPHEIAWRLDLDEGAPVVVRRRLFVVEGEAVELCDSFYPATLAEGTRLADPRKIAGGAHSVIEDPAGPIVRRVTRFVEELTARMPNAAEVAALALLPGGPVVHVLRTVYDADGRPVEVTDSVMDANRYQFRYEVEV
jgi:GntR family transcriptional regulator